MAHRSTPCRFFESCNLHLTLTFSRLSVLKDRKVFKCSPIISNETWVTSPRAYLCNWDKMNRNSKSEGKENSNISFICVPTPTTPEGIDWSYIKEVAKNIGIALANKEGYHVVVVKSTVVSEVND